MKKNRLFFMFAALFVAAAVMFSCQKEEVLNLEEGLMLKNATSCQTCITTPVVEEWDLTGGKACKVEVWNDNTNLYMKVTGADPYEKVKISYPHQVNNGGQLVYNYESDTYNPKLNAQTYTFPLTTPWQKCDMRNFAIRVEGMGGGTAVYGDNTSYATYYLHEYATITSISALPVNPVCVGSEITITADVTASVAITGGTLKIMEGTNTVASLSVSTTSNQLQYKYTPATAGTRTFKAVYERTSGFCDSESTAVDVTVVDCDDCDDASFDYETTDNLNIVFTYNHGEEVENVTIAFTFPQVMNSELNEEDQYVGADGKLYEVNNVTNQTVFTWTGEVSCKAANAETFIFSVLGDCSAPPANDGQAIIWTDAEIVAINGVELVDDPLTLENEGPYSLKGSLKNIVWEGCPESE